MKSSKRKLRVLVEKTSTGFCAGADEYAVYTTGRTISEIIENMVEAFNLHFEDDGIEVKTKNIELHMNLAQFFQEYPVLNAKLLADHIGMNYTLLNQYVNGHKKPSAKQTHRILEGIHEIGIELSELNLLT